MMKLNDIFKNTSYDDTLFSEDSITTIESAIFMKQVKGVETPYIKCLVREKEIKLTPEEAVRQLYIDGKKYDYSKTEQRKLRSVSDRICAEHGLSLMQSELFSRKMPKRISPKRSNA